MPSDSRIEKLVAHYAEDRNVQLVRLQPGDLTETAENVLNHCEAAGLVVADPDDLDTLKRATVALDNTESMWALNETRARAVLAALAVKP